MSEKRERVWSCKVGGIVGEIPMGSDLPMRRAIQEAFRQVTGAYPDFTFSGWGETLTENERIIAYGHVADTETRR